jgi:hypothetical protein
MATTIGMIMMSIRRRRRGGSRRTDLRVVGAAQRQLALPELRASQPPAAGGRLQLAVGVRPAPPPLVLEADAEARRSDLGTQRRHRPVTTHQLPAQHHPQVPPPGGPVTLTRAQTRPPSQCPHVRRRQPRLRQPAQPLQLRPHALQLLVCRIFLGSLEQSPGLDLGPAARRLGCRHTSHRCFAIASPLTTTEVEHSGCRWQHLLALCPGHSYTSCCWCCCFKVCWIARVVVGWAPCILARPYLYPQRPRWHLPDGHWMNAGHRWGWSRVRYPAVGARAGRPAGGPFIIHSYDSSQWNCWV